MASAAKVCAVDGCDRKHYGRGWCKPHWFRWRKYGDPLLGRRIRIAPGGPCSVPGCEREATRHGDCNAHYQRRQQGADLLRPIGKVWGADNVNWRGGRSLDAGGYVKVWLSPDDPLYVMVGKDRYAREHRVVMARLLGRPLLPRENVHHRNGDRADNRIENLELWTKSQTPGQRVDDQVAWARKILALYGGYAARKKLAGMPGSQQLPLEA